ncbi:MAG: hypothetical protein M1839_004994, partial [Geoglossum umbratile]
MKQSTSLTNYEIVKEADSELISHISKSLNKFSETSRHLATTTSHRDILYQKASDDESPTLMKAKFQEML